MGTLPKVQYRKQVMTQDHKDISKWICTMALVIQSNQKALAGSASFNGYDFEEHMARVLSSRLTDIEAKAVKVLLDIDLFLKNN